MVRLSDEIKAFYKNSVCTQKESVLSNTKFELIQLFTFTMITTMII